MDGVAGVLVAEPVRVGVGVTVGVKVGADVGVRVLVAVTVAVFVGVAEAPPPTTVRSTEPMVTCQSRPPGRPGKFLVAKFPLVVPSRTRN